MSSVPNRTTQNVWKQENGIPTGLLNLSLSYVFGQCPTYSMTATQKQLICSCQYLLPRQVQPKIFVNKYDIKKIFVITLMNKNILTLKDLKNSDYLSVDFYLSKSCNKSCHYCTAWTLEMRNLTVDMDFLKRNPRVFESLQNTYPFVGR